MFSRAWLAASSALGPAADGGVHDRNRRLAVVALQRVVDLGLGGHHRLDVVARHELDVVHGEHVGRVGHRDRERGARSRERDDLVLLRRLGGDQLDDGGVDLELADRDRGNAELLAEERGDLGFLDEAQRDQRDSPACRPSGAVATSASCSCSGVMRFSLRSRSPRRTATMSPQLPPTCRGRQSRRGPRQKDARAATPHPRSAREPAAAWISAMTSLRIATLAPTLAARSRAPTWLKRAPPRSPSRRAGDPALRAGREHAARPANGVVGVQIGVERDDEGLGTSRREQVAVVGHAKPDMAGQADVREAVGRGGGAQVLRGFVQRGPGGPAPRRREGRRRRRRDAPSIRFRCLPRLPCTSLNVAPACKRGNTECTTVTPNCPSLRDCDGTPTRPSCRPASGTTVGPSESMSVIRKR